jgi:hypothetical protein
MRKVSKEDYPDVPPEEWMAETIYLRWLLAASGVKRPADYEERVRGLVEILTEEGANDG